MSAHPEGKAAKSLLTFRPTGRVLEIEQVKAEFEGMLAEFLGSASSKTKEALGSVEKFAAIGASSGTHLLKLISPRTSGDRAILRIVDGGNGAELLPSVNAADIPLAKIVFRPIEIAGHGAMTIVEHLRNPTNLSPLVIEAFSEVFGPAIVNGLRVGLKEVTSIDTIPATEFPVVFLPLEGFGDIQITPVAPATAYMNLRDVRESFFAKKEPGSQRGDWVRQTLTSKPQNISGAIGGPRTRLCARMPSVLQDTDAGLHRYRNGGAFPSWRQSHVTEWVISYANWLDSNDTFNNSDTRQALDNIADGLIRAAVDFVHEVLGTVRELDGPLRDGDPPRRYDIPAISSVILRRKWSTDHLPRARQAIGSAHFARREREILSQETF